MSKTIKERVNSLSAEYGLNEKCEKEILELINRVQFPSNYCPKCDNRMFFSEEKGFVCECGYVPEKPIIKSKKINNVAELAKKLNDGGSQPNIPGMPGEIPPGAASKNVNWL